MITATCQRWRERRDPYRPAGEVIATSLYEVAPIVDGRTAKLSSTSDLTCAHKVRTISLMNTTPLAATIEALTVGMRVQLVKGCKARGLDKGISARIQSVTELGADYGHEVKVVLQPLNGFQASKNFAFYARHITRLSDAIVRLNDGNPSHTIEVRRVAR